MNLRIVAQPEYFLLPCLLAQAACVVRHVAPRTTDLQDGLSSVASTASLRDNVVVLHLVTWAVQRSGGRPLGRLYSPYSRIFQSEAATAFDVIVGKQ